MEWLQFEHEIRELVEAFGYQAEVTSPSHDFGVDVIAHRKLRKVLIQCKFYSKGKIGGDTMMKLIGSRQYFKATDAICITTSQFTKQAQVIADKENIKLIDREKLILLCQELKLTIPSLTILVSSSKDLHSIVEPEINIGREKGNHIVLSSPRVSRFHAKIERNKLWLTIRDCNSTNGIKLNGRRISGSEVLKYFDNITIGDMLLTVAIQTPNGKLQVKF